MLALYHHLLLQGQRYSVILYEIKNILVEARFLSVSMFGNQDFIGMAKGEAAEGNVPEAFSWLPG